MNFMRTIPLLFALGFAPLTSAQAASDQVFKCVDANGKITYTNDRDAAKGCQVLDTEQAVSTIPMKSTSVSTTGTGTNTPTPPSFPRVTTDAQRERDTSRRQLLENELAVEQRALEEAQQALAAQEAIRTGDEKNYQKVLDRLQPFKDKVDQHQRNIEALNREISGLN
jgi:hypothetical protein